MSATDRAARFAAVLGALNAAHEFGDVWVQTHEWATAKTRRDRAGRRALAWHVGTYTATQAAAMLALDAVTGNRPHGARYALALGISAGSHYVIDQRWLLEALTVRLQRFGKHDHYRLGAPRPGRDDNPTLGTGAYALDQAAHKTMIFLAALAAAAISDSDHRSG